MQSLDKALKEYQQINKDIKNNYKLKCSEMFELREGKELFNIMCDTFAYGFIKGMRYQKAQEERSR